ncbi:GNAT family N-acetyltransferase [Aerosakkonemataceae cyanobacterium BLCC-F50]|uniref:GNAT family N-acetyltransferase n=1 Tax=Floridaenema flaviceps BLCC-F50 TaxID=3153642 RepID=A0ABV4XMQ4_9CYAN
MLTLTKRPYGGETDLEAIVNLWEACEAVDRLEQWTTVSELERDFNDPSFDKQRDLQLWEDDTGKLIASATLWHRLGELTNGYLGFHVHPDARGGTLEREIINWGEERLRELAKEQGVNSVKLRCQSRDDRTDRIAILQENGFNADRYFLTMERSLEEPLAEPQFPAGFTVRSVIPEKDAEAWVEMHNQSFIDHWNHHDIAVDEYKHWRSNPDYRPELDLVAIAPDDTFASYCYCAIYPEDNKRSDRQEGWVNTLGTRRGFRRLGLGKAMLLSGMQKLLAAGMNIAKLGVDYDNPNGARQLYESVGFRKLYTWVSYYKVI